MASFQKKNKKANPPHDREPRSADIKRAWGNAARLEHVNVRNKNKGKKGK